MAPQTPPEPPRCCCFNVKTTTVALGIFHMVMSVLLLIEYSLEVANGKGFCKDLDKDYYRIAPFGSFQVLFGIEITGISTFPPQKKERFLIPFLALQIIDFLLSLLTMFSSYIRVPAVISVSSLGHTVGGSSCWGSPAFPGDGIKGCYLGLWFVRSPSGNVVGPCFGEVALGVSLTRGVCWRSPGIVPAPTRGLWGAWPNPTNSLLTILAQINKFGLSLREFSDLDSV
uniref:Uncharacterized protein n=1 Tax=Malurus cyaneus samueli TaxID=2593467 RepID=A0A8C5UFA5_9PASS